jgi:hypothetical protein
MNKKILVAVVALSFIAGGAFAGRRVKDWRDLHKAHMHLQQVIKEMERARAANNYDMAGHGAKAEDLVRQAERELGMAVEAAKGEK